MVERRGWCGVTYNGETRRWARFQVGLFETLLVALSLVNGRLIGENLVLSWGERVAHHPPFQIWYVTQWLSLSYCTTRISFPCCRSPVEARRMRVCGEPQIRASDHAQPSPDHGPR